ncbi:MAG TPA: sulfotransferase [Ktedonobacter sp.]|nr:sulfotransferase [Ktedonobacter sp.]
MMPNFFVVGAARAGTTSLNRYLNQHPDIYISPRKEVHFFAAEHFPYKGPGDEGMNRLVVHDEQQYLQLFAGVTGEKAIGETSPFYLCLPGTVERMAHMIPDAKIIILLREPVDRLYSAFMHLVREGRETLSLEEGLGREAERKQQGFEPMWWYKELSLYSSQVKHYMEVFGKEHVKIILYEEFSANPRQALREIFAFLGVSEDVVIDTSVRYNAAGVAKSRKLYTLLTNFIRRPNALQKRLKSLLPWRLRDVLATKAVSMLVKSVPMDTRLHEQLKPYFAEDVAQLEELLNRDLSCWHYNESVVQK